MNKNAEGTTMDVIKQKLQFQDYKNYLEAGLLEKEINSLKKINAESLREPLKEVIKAID